MTDMVQKVQLVPAKRFFVEMLTRDIDLIDAILDLIDNCLDGALRSGNKTNNLETPYAGYKVEITYDQGHFKILDNCGGIPRDIAIESAFRLGRPNGDRDKDLATVGVYGIGMKRAIFKMGEDAYVRSQTDETCFEVDITKEWMQDDSDWEIPIKDVEPSLKEAGTIIEVKDIRPGIKSNFADEANFKKNLFDVVSTHFSYICKKGLEIVINGDCVVPKITITAFNSDFSSKEKSIAPYIYQNNIDGVSINMVIGFYRSLGTDKEESDEKEGKSRSENAGITVICNDRVVLYNDKSRETGWGEAGVPSYHTQFIGISGVVVFQSNDPSKLPLKTTKRGVDGSTDIYAIAKEHMRTGIKLHTSFTNKWKKSDDKEELSEYFNPDNLVLKESIKISELVREEDWKKLRRSHGGVEFKPRLPEPKQDKTKVRVTFMRDKKDIETLADHFFGEKTTPADVGQKCVDEVLGRIS